MSTRHTFRTSRTSPQPLRLRRAGLTLLVALAAPAAAFAQAGTRVGPVVGPNGTVIDSPVVVPADTAASSVEAAFQTADQNKDGFLSPAEAISVPALASEFRNLDKSGDGALTLQEIQTPKTAVEPAPSP